MAFIAFFIAGAAGAAAFLAFIAMARTESGLQRVNLISGGAAQV